ncbi:MAG: PorT family protein [Bacteroidia bacterium]|nr:PorT family protein [Bacteroidia bacterium]
MKYLVLTLAFVSFHFVATAQDESKTVKEIEERYEIDEVTSDTTKITIKTKTVTIIKDEDGRHISIEDSKEVLDEAKKEFEEREEEEWDEKFDYQPKERVDERKSSQVGGLALDLGFAHFINGNTFGNNAVNPELAIKDFRLGSHVALHVLPTRVSIAGKGKVNIKTAISVDWNNYYFTSNVTLIEGDEGIEFGQAEENLSKNKLTTRYAQIPLLLNFNTAPGQKNNVSFSVGGYGGLLWSAHTKQVTEEGKKKTKNKGNYNLNPIRYGLTARLDFRWLDIYVNYNLSEVFAQNEGPTTQTFEAGINVIDF